MGLFEKIFGIRNPKNKGTTLRMLNGYNAQFTTYDGNIYKDTLVRSCIDAIARNAAKLNPKHIRRTEAGIKRMNSGLQDLMSKRPNELMNAYDFLYKIATELYRTNNSFVYISRNERGEAAGFYPITAGCYTLVEYNGDIYIRFNFNGGKSYTASLKDDVIHLKRFFGDNDLMGSDNLPIVKTMSLKHVMDEGLFNAIRTTQSIKGILKTEKSMLKPEDVKAMRNQFVQDFVNNGDSGIAGLDATMSFVPVNLNPTTATDSQLESIRKEVFEYFGVSEGILQSKYTEDEWNAFYESTLEPFAVMLSLEFTNKVFSRGEQFHGNEVIFEANRLQYVSVKTKIQLAKELHNYFTINEIREVFNMAPREDGDIILQDLNHINSDIADDYQGGSND